MPQKIMIAEDGNVRLKRTRFGTLEIAHAFTITMPINRPRAAEPTDARPPMPSRATRIRRGATAYQLAIQRRKT